MRVSKENIERETLEKNKIDSSTIFTLRLFKFLYSHLSIVTSLRGSLSKPFLTIPTSVRRQFGAWEVVRKGPISYWLMLWAITKSGKLKKK